MRVSDKIIVLTMVLLGVSGCGSKLDTSDVAGTYQAVFPYGVETLTLNADGSYVQRFTYKDGNELRNEGAWQFSSVKQNDIRLSNALIVDDGFGKPATVMDKKEWVIGARKNSFKSSLSLHFNDDLGVCFKRQIE